ncbi:transcriptional regulator, LacI family [Sanguibacter gelidistatuariae]|uniref:Transcriptional regulator, LacI family n=1 Tax=Sanguibacter gelidistatuariae TaxID=1814289 RepID=A0A1G6QL29_9MICO|nr:LacI family DNA-binding transcriptional regulator [Sanguibacter gelidistatuariae]SDC92921.1 transcriptional regulator, LacI family [Sanguibacter gelidistatuariae]
MGQQAPTLEEVAHAAGVSRSTASRAINGGSRVSPEAQQAVDDAIARLGYVPNRAARSLVTRRTNSIALVVPEPDERVLTDPFFAATVRGINSALRDWDLQLVLLFAQPDETPGRISRYLRNGHVDGAIVVSHHRRDDLEGAIEDSRIPAVFVGRPFRDFPGLRFVDVDNVAGGFLATNHLIAQGRTNIAHVGGPSDMAAGEDRLAGWRQALTEAGMAEGPLARGDFTTVSGVQAMETILALDPTVDAVFAASDLMAMGVLRVLAKHGRSVPEDVAVIGYDDLGVAEGSVPALTTISNPVVRMARYATDELLVSLGFLDKDDFVAQAGDSVPVVEKDGHIILAPVLVPRASS